MTMNDPAQQPPDPIECPFCHNKYSPRLYGWHERLEESGEVVHRYAVRCLNCGARGPHTAYGHLAIEAWNNRERSWLEKKPAAPAPDWSKAPSWAQWWAVDADDNVAWFQNQPFCIGSGWFNPGGMTQTHNSMLPYHLPIGIDWRTTLQARPTEEE